MISKLQAKRLRAAIQRAILAASFAEHAGGYDPQAARRIRKRKKDTRQKLSEMIKSLTEESADLGEPS